jgi:hypothetical protein
MRGYTMKNYQMSKKLERTIEEVFERYQIHIVNNPDRYRGGYEWSVSKDNEMLDSGLAFNVEDAILEAKTLIIQLNIF